MKKLAIVVFVFFVCSSAVAVDFYLPIPPGEVWQCTQGNSNPDYTHNGKLQYAWDFDWVDGEGNGKPIYPPADATVVQIYRNIANQDGTQGWGNLVVIEYDDGTFGKFAHVLDLIPVNAGQRVYQGKTVLAFVGGTSGVENNPYPSHIHYQRQLDDSINGQSIESDFVDVPDIGGIPISQFYYVAGGIGMDEVEGWTPEFSRKFLDCFVRSGGYEAVGQLFNDGSGPFIHYWIIPGKVDRYLVQNFRNSKGEESAILYDTHEGSQAYWIFGDNWEFYGRAGLDGRFGPDMPTRNPQNSAETVGSPISDAVRIAGKWLHKLSKAIFKEGSVEAYRNDGSLFATYDPVGDTSPFSITGFSGSENHNVIKIKKGILNPDKILIYENEQFVGETTLDEFAKAGLSPGDVSTYIAEAWSNTLGVIGVSNEITIVSPGEVAASMTIQGAADGHTYIYVEWDDVGVPFYLLFVNGVQVAKLTYNRRTIGPLEPNTTYSIRAVAITASDLVLEWSNVIEVATDPAPPEPPLAEPVPTKIIIYMPKTHWEFGETGYVTFDVLDRLGNVMTGQRVLFIGSDSSVMAVSGDNGYLLAHGLGNLEVWAELYDNRAIKSERVYVEVVEPASETPSPVVYPSAPLMLIKKITQAFEGPLVEGRAPMFTMAIINPNDFVVSFYYPSIRLFSLDGQSLEFSPYPNTLITLQPGESWEGNISSVYLLGPGIKYLQGQIRLAGSGVDDWNIIDQGDVDVPVKTYIEVISENDLKANLRFNSISATSSEYFEGDDVVIRMWLINPGDVDATQPFTLTYGVAGRDTQSIEIPGLNRGDLLKVEVSFSGLPAGSYKIDFWLDSGDVIPEYNEGDNIESLIVEIQEVPDIPGLVVAPQISDITIVRDYNDPCGPYQDDRNTSLGIYTRKGINRFGRGLLNFDLSELPLNIKIESAYVDLFGLEQGEYVGNDFYLNLLVEMFDPNFVDWCFRDSQNFWQSPGGAWTSFGQASVFIPSFYTGGWHYQTGEVNQWFTWDVTQMIQAIVDGQLEFNGFILRQEDILNSQENQGVNFASMDHPDSGLRPRLVVQYNDTPPEQLPDLLVERVDFSSRKRGKNAKISVDVWIKNGGTQDATAFSVEIKVVESGKVYTRTFSGLQAGESVPISISERLKKVNSATLQITIDTQDEVIESDESNNYVEDYHAL